jgi:hypothetical protein
MFYEMWIKKKMLRHEKSEYHEEFEDLVILELL